MLKGVARFYAPPTTTLKSGTPGWRSYLQTAQETDQYARAIIDTINSANLLSSLNVQVAKILLNSVNLKSSRRYHHQLSWELKNQRKPFEARRNNPCLKSILLKNAISKDKESLSNNIPKES